MFLFRVIAVGAVVVWSALGASIIAGDARRGEQLFQSEQCIQCHSLKGKGGTLAPDLSRRVDRDYTPAVMASLMWNHAPDMWAAMKQQGVKKGNMTPEKAGDAARGKQAFADRHCADCHGIASSKEPAAPPVAKWESLADPMILAQQ